MFNVFAVADKTPTAEELKKRQEDADAFTDVSNNWTALSSGDTVTGELLDFLKIFATLAGKIGDLVSVVNKYI